MTNEPLNVVPLKPVANASGNPEEHPELGPYARSARERAGTRAREKADSQRASDLESLAVDEADSDPWGRLLAFWTPPEIWSQPRPSLSQVAAYAWKGGWTGEETASRRLGCVYAALVSIPAHAVGYVVLWLVERPARLAVTAVLSLLIVLSFIV